jgi:hypothetical protein
MLRLVKNAHLFFHFKTVHLNNSNFEHDGFFSRDRHIVLRLLHMQGCHLVVKNWPFGRFIRKKLYLVYF